MLTTSTTAQQSTTGLLFGNKASSADNKQPLTGGLLFGNSANSAGNVQQTSGLLFGNNTNPTGNVQQSGSVFMVNINFFSEIICKGITNLFQVVYFNTTIELKMEG